MDVYEHTAQQSIFAFVFMSQFYVSIIGIAFSLSVSCTVTVQPTQLGAFDKYSYKSS